MLRHFKFFVPPEVDQALLNVINELGNPKWSEIENHPDVKERIRSPRTLNKHLNKLVTDGLVERTVEGRSKRNRYRLSNKARAGAAKTAAFARSLGEWRPILREHLSKLEVEKRIGFIARYQLALQCFLRQRMLDATNRLEKELLAIELYSNTPESLEGMLADVIDERDFKACREKFRKEYAFFENLYERPADARVEELAASLLRF